MQPAQAAVAQLCLYRLEVFPFQVQGRVEDRLAIGAGAEDAVGHQHMEMDVAVEVAAEPVHERHGAEAGVRRCAGAALADRGFDRAQEDREQAADHLGLVPQVPSAALGHRQHPLVPT
jgi:hypothetical protein